MLNHRGTSTVYGAPTILVSYVPWLMRYCGYYTSARRTSATAQCASYTTVATLLGLHSAQLQFAQMWKQLHSIADCSLMYNVGGVMDLSRLSTSKDILTILATNGRTSLCNGAKAKDRPNNSTRGSISMVDMRNRHQPQVPRHSLQQSPWNITDSNVASRDHRCTTVPSSSPATCSDMQYHVLQRSCSTAPCRLSIWMPPAVVSRWATTSGQYLAHATSN